MHDAAALASTASQAPPSLSHPSRLFLEVLARVLSWALDRRLIDANPCEKGGRLYNASRSDRVWSDKDEAAFMRVASEPLRLAMILALWTGQRQGDLLRLPWSAYDVDRQDWFGVQADEGCGRLLAR